MNEITKDEVEEAMEKGKNEVKAIAMKPISQSDKPWWVSKHIAIAVCMLLSLALVIGLRGIMRSKIKTQQKTVPPETLERFGLEIPDGKGKQPGLPIASLGTLKETYSSCADLSTDLNIALRMLANQTIESNIQSFFHSPYNNHGVGQPVYAFPVTLIPPGPAPPGPAPIEVAGRIFGGGADSNIATSESSFGSNNQEEGVEEPDVIQSDGTSVYAAYGSEIVKLNVEDAQVQSRTKLPLESDECKMDSIKSMLLVDDTLAVISSGRCREYDEKDDTTGNIQLQPAIQPRTSATRIVMYDKNTMELKSGDPKKFIKGKYISARAIGQDIYVITTTSLNYWTFTNKLNIWDQSAFGTNITEDEYREMAVQKVLDTIDEFVGDLTDDYFEDCASVQRLSLFQNEVTGTLPPLGGIMESIATVTGFDVNTPALATSKSLILPLSSWQVYSSQTQLVLAARGWRFGNGASQETYVITYSLADAEATVVGFGTVPGYVLNQYSIDHQNKNGKDYLLFATTTRANWVWIGRGRNWVSRTNATSQITVLEVPQEGGIESGKMEVVGKVEGLGKPGEQIYSVRFQNDRAFVVTFERTDPFYTIDVSDPENPSKVGELEIPGFSSYLHPIGENLIMGVGQYVNETTGRQEGLQISIFDVTDFANPGQIHTFTEASGDNSRSEAEYNPMAFRYLDETGLLILPVSMYSWRRFPELADDETPFNGFKVYKADEEGISEYLRVNHETRDYNFYRNCRRNYQGKLAARSLVFSGVLWTMQGNAIQLSDLSTREINAEPIDLDEGVENVVSCRTPFHCATVSCAIPSCTEDEIPVTSQGNRHLIFGSYVECCPSCSSINTTDVMDGESPDCSSAICATVRCADEEESLVTPEGECCPTCSSGNFETGVDCSSLVCASMVECSQPTFIPEGGCCPECPDEEEEPED